MEPEVAASTPDAFESAVTSASTYVEPTVTATDGDADTQVEHTAAARDANGRFVKPEAEKPAEAVEAKPAEKKPRNDPQARIDQIVKEREDARREAARYKAELDAARAPRPSAPKPQVETAPDANDAAKYPGGEYDPKYLADQARHVARQEIRAEQVNAQAQAEDSRKEREFDTRASSFVTRLKDANAVEAIDRRLLSGKPLSLLTSRERAEIAKLSPQEQNDLGFICFLADQWDGSEHDIALVKYLSDPATFQRLATLPPNQVIRELARVEAGFGAAPQKDVRGSAPKPSASQANPPIKPLGATSHAQADDDGSEDESLDKFISRENAKDRKSGRL